MIKYRGGVEMEIKNISEPILIKFTSLKFAKSFRSGTIYMNTMDYFRRIEGDKNTRGDLFEGTHGIIAKDDFDEILPKIGMIFSQEEKGIVIGGMSLLSEELKYYKVFCMYHLNFNISKRKIEPIDNRINNFGDTFVLITKFEEFKRRIVKELEKEKYNVLGFAGDDILYYNYDSHTQNLGPFKKLSSYSWQNEYRLLAEPIEPTLDPLIFNIGDISDITIIGSTKKLIEEIHFDEKGIFVPNYDL